VSRLLYNKALEIDYTYNQKSNEKYGSDLPSRVMESIEFIVVHYTGNPSAGADGDAHGAWFAEPKSENNTSIHYSTGNDGIFKGLDEQYRAAHAGDDGSRNTVSKFSWIDTPVKVLDTDPEIPVVTITSNATFAINGRDTCIDVPKETKYGRGYVTDSKWLNEQGIGVNIKDGKYQIGTSWWCYTQVGEGRICSNGGNRNSIGIESAINKGSDLWYTWQITAQLVADIMERHDLDITKVKGHHFFTAKNCPQPMLENDLEIWREFIELVKCEYEKITACEGYEFSFECDSELVNEYGRVTGQLERSQVVTYKVTITKDGKTETIELASIIEGAYNNK
jgi:N-acetylmuramoyl-L-alanine amidase CwlA